MTPLRPIDSQVRHDSFSGSSAARFTLSGGFANPRTETKKEGRALPSRFKVPVYWPSGRGRG